MLCENYDNVLNEVKVHCEKVDREIDDVTLIAVSKTKPKEMIQELYEHGCRHFGENKVQELIDKKESLPKDIKWHMIGHLQTNKVKYLIGNVYLIHSVDSMKLANEISKQAAKANITMDILIEVNVANEESKFGTSYEEALKLTKEIANLPYIRVRGFMTIAPFVTNSEENREYFRRLKQLSVDIMRENIDNVSVDFLSMGMTNDYQVAIEEGANFVRVGTGIFGDRIYI